MSVGNLEQIKRVSERLDLCLSAGNLAWWEMNVETGNVIFNENKVKMLGYSVSDFTDVDYTAFTDLVHPDDYDNMMKIMREYLDGKRPLYEVKYRIKCKDGKYKWFHDRGSIVERNQHGKPLALKGVVFDITEEKRSKEKLEELNDHLEQRIHKRTKELEETNRKLKEEVYERKKTQQYLERTKNNLRNVIDSAAEFIVSFDVMNRINIWNKTAEKITKYNQIDVLNRSVGKLDVFENPDLILDYIDQVCQTKAPKTFDIIIRTKEQDTRIIRVAGTKVVGANNDCVGSLFMGRDITEEVSLHKKLLPGNSYIITDEEYSSSFDLLSELTIDGYNGLLITRGNPDQLQNQIKQSDQLRIVLLSKKSTTGMDGISTLEAVKNTIESFTNDFDKSVILFDGVHYLLSRFNFDAFIKLLYDINDIIVEQKAILFVRIDPSTIQAHQMALLKNELIQLPNQQTKDIIIRDDLYDLIKYIYYQNQDNAIVSVKKVMNRLKVTYVTAASRIDSLEEKGLIYSKKQGKIRAIYVTDKGKRLIHKRKTL